jgi:hypothetical protein
MLAVSLLACSTNFRGFVTLLSDQDLDGPLCVSDIPPNILPQLRLSWLVLVFESMR